MPEEIFDNSFVSIGGTFLKKIIFFCLIIMIWLSTKG